jgi:hypothetical protein
VGVKWVSVQQEPLKQDLLSCIQTKPFYTHIKLILLKIANNWSEQRFLHIIFGKFINAFSLKKHQNYRVYLLAQQKGLLFNKNVLPRRKNCCGRADFVCGRNDEKRITHARGAARSALEIIPSGP